MSDWSIHFVYVDRAEEIFVDPADDNGGESYAMTNKVRTFARNDSGKIAIIESDHLTITINSTDCQGTSEPAIDGYPAVRHFGQVNALLYGGRVEILDPARIDLEQDDYQPLVVWWLPNRENNTVCGTVVVVVDDPTAPGPSSPSPSPTSPSPSPSSPSPGPSSPSPSPSSPSPSPTSEPTCPQLPYDCCDHGFAVGEYSSNLTESLVARWTFNNATFPFINETGDAAWDGTPQGAGAVRANNATIDQPRYGTLLCDGGNNSWIGVGNTALNHTDPRLSTYSVSLWCRANGPNDRSHGVIRKGHDYGPEGFKIRLNGGNRQFKLMFGGWGGSPGDGAQSTAATQRFEWYHTGFVIDRENQQYRVFFNGQFSNGWNSMNSATDIARNDINGMFGLGKHGQIDTGTKYKSLQGRLDDVRVYHRALNECDIARLYNSGDGLPQDGVQP